MASDVACSPRPTATVTVSRSSPLLSSPPRRSWPKGRINNQADRRHVVIWREGHFARHYPDEKGMTRKKSFVTLFGARKSVSLVGSISISPMKSWPNKRLAQTADHAANHSIRTNRHCLSHREESSLVAQHSKKCVTTADSLTRASGRPLRLSNQRNPNSINYTNSMCLAIPGGEDTTQPVEGGQAPQGFRVPCGGVRVLLAMASYPAWRGLVWLYLSSKLKLVMGRVWCQRRINHGYTYTCTYLGRLHEP